MASYKDIVINILGCGGHARSVADVIIDNNPRIKLVFFDENAKKGETILNEFKVMKLKYAFCEEENKYVVAVGNNIKREALFGKIETDRVLSVIARNSYISSFAALGIGCFVGRMAQIGAEATIGCNCIINDGAIIEHECSVGDSSHISVGAKICGRSVVGKRVFVGAGATVINNVSICDDVVVGAGAVVISDIEESGTYVGVPARKTHK